MPVITKKKAKPAPLPVPTSKKADIRWEDINKIKPNEYNPNSMDDRVFDELVKDITAEEMDQPIVVIPDPNAEGEWIIVDGEHRWRGSKAAGLTEVPISVRDYTPEEAMIKTVRRNVLHGELDKSKFSAMLHNLNTQHGITAERARELMAVDSREFAKVYKGPTEKTTARAEQLIANADKGVQLTAFVANLSQMVRDIVQEGGEDIEDGYIGFLYKGKPCLMVSMDASLHKIVSEYLSCAREDGKGQEEISQDLKEAFKKLIGV